MFHLKEIQKEFTSTVTSRMADVAFPYPSPLVLCGCEVVIHDDTVSFAFSLVETI